LRRGLGLRRQPAFSLAEPLLRLRLPAFSFVPLLRLRLPAFSFVPLVRLRLRLLFLSFAAPGLRLRLRLAAFFLVEHLLRLRLCRRAELGLSCRASGVGLGRRGASGFASSGNTSDAEKKSILDVSFKVSRVVSGLTARRRVGTCKGINNPLVRGRRGRRIDLFVQKWYFLIE
jgi:hypothetical protein